MCIYIAGASAYCCGERGGVHMDPGINREFALSIAARSPMGSSDGGEARLQAYMTSLEEEKRKIEAFKRDLPLSVHLLNDGRVDAVIEMLNRDLEQRRGRTSLRVFGQVITTEIQTQEQHELGSNSERRGAQLTGGAGRDPFAPIEGYPAQKLSDATEKGTDLAIIASGVGGSGSKVALGLLIGDQLNLLTPPQPARLPPPRKARRCWSKELHGQFLAALELLGGAQFATPKQIREVMNVDELTSDQVRSHLQKHRLNIQKTSNSSNAVNGPLNENATWQSGPDPQTFRHRASFNIGDSCDEQGDKSGI